MSSSSGLLAFVCPVYLPYWIVLIGDFFAIVVVKQLFGGLGKNFLNPALAGRAFLMLCYPVEMTTWVLPGPANWAGVVSAVDAVTGATPLSADFMHGGLLPEGVTLADMFVGNVGGCIGEVSALALLLGGGYLLLRKVISWRIPVAYLGSVALLTLIFSKGQDPVLWMLYSLMGGGVLLGAFFMATDYATSPVTPMGQLIYGVGCGVLTVCFRYYGLFPEGVTYAILLMNACAWSLDRLTPPKRFGTVKGGGVQ